MQKKAEQAGIPAPGREAVLAQVQTVSESLQAQAADETIGALLFAAVALCRQTGVDPEKARRAAILHDCTKYWDLETQVAACDKYGIALDELERVSVKFLHAKTGAALAQYVFGEPDDVYDAIFCHTTGKPGMTKLDKVLYLADYMEPSRAFDGVEELRRLVWEDLDQAMILGLEMTVEELRERGAVVHQNTQGTLDDLRRKLR